MADSSLDFLRDGGEMGALMRAHDWSSTAFGPLSSWPQSLRSMVSAVLNSPLLGTVLWGPDLRMLYNDAYIPSMADLHPGALGRPVREVWGDAWTAVAPNFERVLSSGRGFIVENMPLRVKRREVAEITYWNFTATPIRGEDGSIVGLLNQGTEITAQVLSRQRELFMSKISDALREIVDPRQLMHVAAESLGEFLKADRAGYAEISADDVHFTIASDWTCAGMPSLAGHHRLADFGPLQIEAFREGRIVAVTDSLSDPMTQGGEAVSANLAQTQLRATLTVPLVKNERFVAALYVHCREPRHWSEDDQSVSREVAERTWAAVERARAEAELQRSEARFRSAIRAAPFIGTWDWDLLTDQVFADERFATLYSVEPAMAARGVPISAFFAGIHPEDREDTAELIREAITSGSEFRSEYRLQSSDGTVRWVLAQGMVQYDPAGRAVNFPGVAIDITDKKLLENRQQAMIEFTDRTRNISNQAEIAFIASEIIGLALGASRAGYGIVDLRSETIVIERGWCEPGLAPLPQVMHFRDYGSYIEDIRRGETVVLADASGDERTTAFAKSLQNIQARAFVNMPVQENDETVALLYVTQATPREWSMEELAFLSDIAERTRIAAGRARAESELRHLNANLEARVTLRTEELERAQEALRQSQKMEAVGQLTGGLAHDFNNLLTGITGSLELLNVRVQQGRVGELDRYVHAAQGAAKRAAALTHRLLAFSRRQTLDPKPTDVNRLVIGMSELLQRTIGPAIALESVAASGLWATIIDPGQLENALLNLCINGAGCDARRGQADHRNRQPMAGRTGGTRAGRLARAVRDGLRQRYRNRHASRGGRSGLRSLFHHQADWHGNRSRTFDGLWICTAIRRTGAYLLGNRQRHDGLFVFPAAYGRGR